MKTRSKIGKLSFAALSLVLTLVQPWALKATTLPITVCVTNYSGDSFHFDLLYQSWDGGFCNHIRTHSNDGKGNYPNTQAKYCYEHDTIDTDHCADQSVTLEIWALNDPNTSSHFPVSISPTNKFDLSSCDDQKGTCNLHNFNLYYDRPNCDPGQYCAKAI